MAASGLYKYVSQTNTLPMLYQKQMSLALQTIIPKRFLSTNPSHDDTPNKVHKMKYTSPETPPTWHKLIPSKSLKEKIANKQKPAVAILNLNGQIAADMGRGGGIGGKQSLNINSTRKLIDSSFKTPRLEAVLLSINSPGGSPAQSELISDYIQLLAKEKNVKVYSFVQDVAASGGYWLACAGEQIYITENSIVGSIGVISASFGFQDAIKYLMVEPRIHTAGAKKVLNNPFLPQKQEDLEKTRKILDKFHTNFKIHVTKNRGEKIKEQDLDTLFSGEYWVGREAIDLGLADDVGTIDTFIRKEFGGPEMINVKEIISPKSKIQKLFGASNYGIDWESSNTMEQLRLMQMLQINGLLQDDCISPIKYKV